MILSFKNPSIYYKQNLQDNQYKVTTSCNLFDVGHGYHLYENNRRIR